MFAFRIIVASVLVFVLASMLITIAVCFTRRGRAGAVVEHDPDDYRD